MNALIAVVLSCTTAVFFTAALNRDSVPLSILALALTLATLYFSNKADDDYER